MDLEHFLSYVNQGLPLEKGSEVYRYMEQLSAEAMRRPGKVH